MAAGLKITRRDFVLGTIVSLFTVGMPSVGKSIELSGIEWSGGHLFMAGADSPRDSSLYRFDLKTGTKTVLPLKMGPAHDVLSMGDRFFVMPNAPGVALLTSEKLTICEVEAGEGFAFTGHALFDEDAKLLIVAARDRAKRNEGQLLVVDPENGKVLDRRSMLGRNPHDMLFVDAETIAVCNYDNDNDGYQKSRPDGFTLSYPSGSKSHIGFYDRKKLEPKKMVPAYDNAAVSHIAQAANGELYTIGFQEYSLSSVTPDLFQEKLEMLAPVFGMRAEDVAGMDLQAFERKTRALGLPAPVLRLSLGGDAVEMVGGTGLPHRRAQSIVYHPDTNIIAASYPNSDTLALVDCGSQSVRSLGKKQLGLEEIRGLAAVPGSSLLAAAGSQNGMILVDSITGEVVKRMAVKLGNVTHMHYSK